MIVEVPYGGVVRWVAGCPVRCWGVAGVVGDSRCGVL